MGSNDIEVEGFEIRDDEDYEGGGFEDPNVNPSPAPKDEGDEGGEGGEGGEGDKTAEGDTKTAGEPDGDDANRAGGAGDAAGEPADDPQFELFRQLQAQNEQLTQAVVGLNAKVDALQAPAAAHKPGTDGPNDTELALDDAPMPTDRDWAADPNKASEMATKHHLAKMQAKINASIDKRLSAASEETTAATRLRQQQDEGWESAVKICPELNIEGHPIRVTAAKILNNEANGLSKLAMGPWLAASSAMTVNGYVPKMAQKDALQQGQQQGAAAERDRQGRLKAGVMNTGGKGGGTTITMDAEHKRTAKTMGVSEKAYAEALKANQ